MCRQWCGKDTLPPNYIRLGLKAKPWRQSVGHCVLEIICSKLGMVAHLPLQYLGGRGRRLRSSMAYSWLQSEFKASLGYIRVSSKQTKRGEKNLKIQTIVIAVSGQCCAPFVPAPRDRGEALCACWDSLLHTMKPYLTKQTKIKPNPGTLTCLSRTLQGQGLQTHSIR